MKQQRSTSGNRSSSTHRNTHTHNSSDTASKPSKKNSWSCENISICANSQKSSQNSSSKSQASTTGSSAYSLVAGSNSHVTQDPTPLTTRVSSSKKEQTIQKGNHTHHNVASSNPKDSGYSLYRQDVYRGAPAHYYECPVEVQIHEPCPPEQRDTLVREMESEFTNKCKVTISGLPVDCTKEELIVFFKEFSCTPVSKIKDGSVRVLFPGGNAAKEGLSLLNSTMFKCHKLSASFGHADSLLFVGNLPFTYTREDLLNLFTPHGEILRCFVVCSPESGLRKGYGFVEFCRREEAMLAKQQMATKVVGLRSLRVDFSDNGMQTCEDLHSQTLFVDRLPKGFREDGHLWEMFSKYGRVNFCQVAVAAGTGISRGFAFIDMSSSAEAERAQLACNGAMFAGQEIRVSFGMPCRHGACILQHKNNGPFNAAGKLNGPHAPIMTENSFPHSHLSHMHHPHHHHSNLLLHSRSESSLTSLSPLTPLPSPLGDMTNTLTGCHHSMGDLTGSLSTGHHCMPGIRRTGSLTQLHTLGLPPAPPSSTQQSCGITQSISAPTILTHQPNPHVNYPVSTLPLWAEQGPSCTLGIGRSRSAHSWREENDVDHVHRKSSLPCGDELLQAVSTDRSFLGKRLASDMDTDDVFTDSASSSSSSSGVTRYVYDKPYIGQHQQGIPFTHPLKRIRMEQC